MWIFMFSFLMLTTNSLKRHLVERDQPISRPNGTSHPHSRLPGCDL